MDGYACDVSVVEKPLAYEHQRGNESLMAFADIAVFTQAFGIERVAQATIEEARVKPESAEGKEELSK